MLYQLRKKINAWRFDWQIGGILSTSPLRRMRAGCTIVSMVAPGDTLMYLLTLKRLYPMLGGGDVVAIIHREMPEDSQDLLREHIPFIEIVIREDIDTGPCQWGVPGKGWYTC